MTYTTTYVPSRPPLPPTPTLSIFVHRELLADSGLSGHPPAASDQSESPSSAGDSEKSTAILASCTLPRPALRSAELARLTPSQSLGWRSSWRIICIRRTPNGAVSRERGHPATAVPTLPWLCERSSSRRAAPPAASRRIHGELHPWLHPWRHGWHVAPGPREGRRGLGATWLFRRRARNAPDQVDERRTG